jgi:hypothetical protein
MYKIRTAAIALLVCAAIIVSYVLISDAYGEGPPYYGRTVNMDKWTSPLPIVVPIDLVALAAVAWLAAGRVRRR